MPMCVSCVRTATQYLNAIGQCLILFFAIIGNVLIVLIFISRKATLRKSSSSFYFASIAIVSTLYIATAVTWHVSSSGFRIEEIRTSLVYCKLRMYLLDGVFPELLYTLECAAAISQFLATSRDVRYRQISTHKVTGWCITISIAFWCLHGIPYLIFNTIKPESHGQQARCIIFNTALRHYTTWVVQNLFNFVLPSVILAVFGYLTVRNIRLLGNSTVGIRSRVQIERHVSFMLLIQIVSILIGCIPLGIMKAYRLLTEKSDKNPEQRAIEGIVQTVAYLLVSTSFANSFYLFYATSVSFRQQCKLALPCIFCFMRRQTNGDMSLSNPSTIRVQRIA